MDIRFKVWLEKGGEVVVGNGKVGLLKMIADLGSIQKAADNLGMSYRHAWGMIQKIEKRSGIKFVETQVGGREGGGKIPLFLKEELQQGIRGARECEYSAMNIIGWNWPEPSATWAPSFLLSPPTSPSTRWTPWVFSSLSGSLKFSSGCTSRPPFPSNP